MQAIDKPDELLALHDVTEELFDTLKRWFDVADEVMITLDDVDGAVEELGDPVMIAALAMRKLQALRLLAQPGVRTTTDVVVTIVQDLDRALLQAPTMWLKRAAARTDWDAAFAAMVEDPEAPAATDDPAAAGAATDLTAENDAARGPTAGDGAPDRDDDDPEITRFRELHGGLHRALRAVVTVSDGQIRVLV